jgi:hypothetical protein
VGCGRRCGWGVGVLVQHTDTLCCCFKVASGSGAKSSEYPVNG